MRRLKTWLRVNTEANHLNNIMLANIQKKDLDKVDMKSVAREFSEKNERRMDYFEKF